MKQVGRLKMHIRFTKMQVIGNDFIVIDGISINLEYLNLSQRILSMYSYKDNEDYINLESKVVEREEPKDFEVELPL